MGIGGIIGGVSTTYHMNRLADTILNGVPQYDLDGAAVRWAKIVLGSTDATRAVDALNQIYANRNSGKNYNYDLQGVLNALAGTTGLGEAEAARNIAA